MFAPNVYSQIPPLTCETEIGLFPIFLTDVHRRWMELASYT